MFKSAPPFCVLGARERICAGCDVDERKGENQNNRSKKRRKDREGEENKIEKERKKGKK